MKEIPGVIFHLPIINLISQLKKARWGTLKIHPKAATPVSCYCGLVGSSFEFKFTRHVADSGNKTLFGRQLKNVQFSDKSRMLILEDFFIGQQTLPSLTSTVTRVRSSGFSKKRNYYYRLVIPLKERLSFHYQVECAIYSSDIFRWSKSALVARIIDDDIYCTVFNIDKEYYLSVDSRIKQQWGDFSDKALAVINTLGYICGHLPGDQGFYIAYREQKMKDPDFFYLTPLRTTIKSRITPVNTNPFSYLRNRKVAERFYEGKLLYPISSAVFSTFCQKLHSSTELTACVILILESSVASLLFRPGGYAIALEMLSDMIIGNTKNKLAPIKDKLLSKKIRSECSAIIKQYGSRIEAEDLKTLLNRIEQLNQQTNTSRLRTPFDILGIKLLPDDLMILKTRNDFLHGRFPDLTKAGKERTEDRINLDLYYASTRLYTLLSMLLLKWVGFDNYVINHAGLCSGYCKISISEEPYRKV